MKYLFNTPIITAYGTFRYRKITVDEAVEFIWGRDWTSSIGHAAVADIFTQLSGVEVPVVRQRAEMKPGDIALVFRILRRPPEGARILGLDELRAIPHEYGLLEMLKGEQ